MDTLDFVELSESIRRDVKVPYESNKHLFTKIAFDVFQMNGTKVDSLWKLEDGADGKQYLVALYDDEGPEEKINAKSSWATLSDKKGQNITLFYKDVPIQRFASSDYGFTNDDVNVFQQTLLDKFSSDRDFLKKFLNTQPEEKRTQILKAFPELV